MAYIAFAPVALWFLAYVWVRPQRGLLVLAALMPFHGLLEIAPAAMQFPVWKEILLVLTLAAAAFTPFRGNQPRPVLKWWWFVLALTVLGAVSALLTLGSSGIFAIRGVVVACSSPPGQRPATGSATAAIAMAHSPAPADPRRRALRLLWDGWGERTCTWTSHSSAATQDAATGMRRTLGPPRKRHMSRTRTSCGPGLQVGNHC